MNTIASLLTIAAGAAALSMGTALAQDLEGLPPEPDQLFFSTTNMDLKADPRVDFHRYAAGGWMDRVQRPARLPAYGFAHIMQERLRAQLKVAVARAGKEAATAEKGSAAQQVGAFYNAYMDTKARDAAGIEPVRGELDRIAAIKDFDDLMRYQAHWVNAIDAPPLGGIGPSPDLKDSKKYVLWAVGALLALQHGNADTYTEAPDGERRKAYRAYITDILKIAGYDADRAAEQAVKIDALEAELYAGLLTPAEKVDPRNFYKPMPFAAFQALIPELDMTLYLKETGYPVPDQVILYEPRYYPVLAKVLHEHSLDEIKDYLSYRVIEHFQGVLTTKFEEPTRALREVLTGVNVLPSREERALALMEENLGQPLGHVYVDNFFSEDTRKKALDVMARIKAAFLARIPSRDWLTDKTRAEALNKAEHLTYKAGYPDKWIDYSGVEIGSDPVADLMHLGEFSAARALSKFDKPVAEEPFNSRSTKPTVINAAYIPSINGFEVPAAFLQPPALEPEADPAVYFCRLGGFIGHEMTHGFDSGGRLYDADGNLRDWWTKEDTTRFNAEAQKLVEQADAYEAIPGLHLNGAQDVKENMADVGGINLAYDALMAYLKDHPDQDVKIDGMTPAQRCFVSWAQMWSEKATDQYIRNEVTTDYHPPNNYRATAPLQHVDAFYEAFGIKEGDPMWLPPEKRVHAW